MWYHTSCASTSAAVIITAAAAAQGTRRIGYTYMPFTTCQCCCVAGCFIPNSFMTNITPVNNILIDDR